MHALRWFDEAALSRLLPSRALRGQFGLIVPIVRTGPGDGDLGSQGDLGKEAFRQRCRQADTAMRGRMSRSGYRARMQPHAVIGEAEEMRHLGPGEAPSRRDLVSSTLGITDHHLARAIVNFAVEVRFLGLLLADYRELTRWGRKFLDSRGHVAPTDLLWSIVKAGLLGLGIDPDVGDLALIPRPLPTFAFGGWWFLHFHGQDGWRRGSFNRRLNLTLLFLVAALGIRKEFLGKTGKMDATEGPELQHQECQGGQEGPQEPFMYSREGTD